MHKSFFSLVGWLENTGNLRDGQFKVHIIDRVRSPHSISVADLDSDGKLEVIVGEHDPFKPYPPVPPVCVQAGRSAGDRVGSVPAG